MTQFQFDAIVKTVEVGAPALANELNNSLNDLVVERNNLADENEKLKKELEDYKSKEAECSCNEECSCDEPAVCETVAEE